MAEVVVNEANFEEEVLKSDIPVIVDFWATWCGPCKMLAPVIHEISEEYAGKVKVCKADTDECPNLAQKYGIMSIPCVFKFEKGEKVATSIGFVPKATLLSTLGL